MSITDEQLAEVNSRISERERVVYARGELGLSCVEAIQAHHDCLRLKIAVSERDATIAELRDRIGEGIGYEIESSEHVEALKAELAELRKEAPASHASWRDAYDCLMEDTNACIGSLRLELAELRKPVAVEANATADKIREAWRTGELNEYSVYDALETALDTIDALAQQCAGYANAHGVLMAERDGLKQRLEGRERFIDDLERQCGLLDKGAERTVLTEVKAMQERERLLREALQKLIRGYVNLLEGGHDRIVMLGGTCDAVDVMEQADIYLREARSALAASPAPVESERERELAGHISSLLAFLEPDSLLDQETDARLRMDRDAAIDAAAECIGRPDLSPLPAADHEGKGNG